MANGRLPILHRPVDGRIHTKRVGKMPAARLLTGCPPAPLTRGHWRHTLSVMSFVGAAHRI